MRWMVPAVSAENLSRTKFVHQLCAGQFEEMYQAAEQGDAWSQNTISICYFKWRRYRQENVEARETSKGIQGNGCVGFHSMVMFYPIG